MMSERHLLETRNILYNVCTEQYKLAQNKFKIIQLMAVVVEQYTLCRNVEKYRTSDISKLCL